MSVKNWKIRNQIQILEIENLRLKFSFLIISIQLLITKYTSILQKSIARHHPRSNEELCAFALEFSWLPASLAYPRHFSCSLPWCGCSLDSAFIRLNYNPLSAYLPICLSFWPPTSISIFHTFSERANWGIWGRKCQWISRFPRI